MVGECKTEANRLWSESQIRCENCGKGYYYYGLRESIYNRENNTTREYDGEKGEGQTSPYAKIRG